MNANKINFEVAPAPTQQRLRRLDPRAFGTRPLAPLQKPKYATAREYAIEWWFVLSPHLTNVSAIPGETWKRENCDFQMLCLWFAGVQQLLLDFFNIVDLRLKFIHNSCTVFI